MLAKVCPQTLYRWRGTGKGPEGFYLYEGSKSYRYYASVVQEWISNQQGKS